MRGCIVRSFGALDPVLPERYRHIKISSEINMGEKNRLQARIMEQLTEAVLLVKAKDSVIAYANPGCEKLFGFEESELLGKAMDQITFHREQWNKVISPEVNDNVFKRGFWKGELEFRKIDGLKVWCSVSITSFTHAQLDEVWLVVCEDITNRKHQDQLIKLSMEQAERANNLKSLFLASMSHEIRTPLNAILGMAGLLAETSLTPEQKKYVRVFQNAGDSLLSLINDILDISKIESQGLELLQDDFDLSKLVEDSIDIFREKARGKDIELLHFVDSEHIPILVGDSARIRQILLNLLSNAIKFTSKGGVFLSVSGGLPKKRETPDGLRYRTLPLNIEVKDTGIGIPEENISKIFQPFTQADAKIHRQFGGTGLGLAITSRLVENMGGRIRVESQPGIGSCFVVELNLPIAKSESEKFQNSDLKSKQEVFQSQNSYLEDQKALLWGCSDLLSQYFSKMLMSSGIGSVISHGDPISELQEAVNNKSAYNFLIMYCDEHMAPACELAKEISKVESLKNLTILTVAGRPNCIKAHTEDSKFVNCSLVHPIHRSEILKEISNRLGLKKSQPVPKIPEKELPSLGANTSVEHIIRVLIVDDGEDNRLLAQAYLKGGMFKTEEAENGIIALNKLKQQKFDIVLMDMQMPEMDGYSAIREYRDIEKREKSPRTPIIALTAYAMKADKLKCIEAGADDYLSKPYKRAQILEIIKENLKHLN